MDVSIAIATFGDGYWTQLVQERALPSAESQKVPVVTVHLPEGTVASARNEALAQVETEFVIFLDADDELEDGYVEAMARGSADLRAPAVRRVPEQHQLATIRSFDDNRAFMPTVFHHAHACEAECLRYGNWLTIGTCARTSLMREVGGWEDWQWSEDWAMWARVWAAGGTVEAIPEAVYRAHYRTRSRNRVAGLVALRIHHEIEMAIWGECLDPLAHPARID